MVKYFSKLKFIIMTKNAKEYIKFKYDMHFILIRPKSIGLKSSKK